MLGYEAFAFKLKWTIYTNIMFVGVFPECFTEFSEFANKNICHYSKRAWTWHLLFKRPGCHHTVPERHIWETESLNRAKFILQRFIRFPEFAEFTGFNESSAPFRKKIVTEVFVKAEVLKPYSLGQTCSSLLSLTRVFVALEVRSTIAGSNQGDSHRSRAVLLLSHRTTACCPNRSIPSR